MSLTSALLQSRLTATLLASILAAVLGSLQIGYHTGNINAPAKVNLRGNTTVDSCCSKRPRLETAVKAKTQKTNETV